MTDWTRMTISEFDADPKLVQGALFAAPDPQGAPGMFALDELDAS